jgi:hypothetical protein
MFVLSVLVGSVFYYCGEQYRNEARLKVQKELDDKYVTNKEIKNEIVKNNKEFVIETIERILEDGNFIVDFNKNTSNIFVWSPNKMVSIYYSDNKVHVVGNVIYSGNNQEHIFGKFDKIFNLSDKEITEIIEKINEIQTNKQEKITNEYY